VPRYSKVRVWARCAIGVTAAYALVLQTVLAGALLSQSAAGLPPSPDDPFVICYGAGDDGTHQPGQQQNPGQHTPCIVLCSVSMSAAIAPPPVVLAERLARGLIRHEPAPPRYDVASHPSPRQAQGPPGTA